MCKAQTPTHNHRLDDASHNRDCASLLVNTPTRSHAALRVGASLGRRRASSQLVGIEARHSRACKASKASDAKCSCQPTYRGVVFAPGRVRSQPFKTPEEAAQWRSDRLVEYRVERFERAPNRETIGHLLGEVLAGMKKGTIVQRGGDAYKLKTIASYEAVIRSRLVPEFGGKRITHLSHRHVQEFIDDLVNEGLSGQTIRNILMPLALIVRRSIQAGTIRVSPLQHLDVPSSKGRRDRAATASDVFVLLAALKTDSAADLFDVTAWTLFFLAGLRHSEAQGLRWGDIDFDHGEIRVRHSWNQSAKVLEGLKSKAARREVPVPELLEEALVELRLQRGIPGADQFVLFDLVTGLPMRQEKIMNRARRVWGARGLDSYTPHEARHTYGSLGAAAGIEAWDLATLMGHSDPKLTFQRYRHIYRDERKRAGQKLDAYLGAG